MSRDASAAGGTEDVLHAAAWTEVLERFARGTGLTVALHARDGVRRVGPYATSPLGLYLVGRGAIDGQESRDLSPLIERALQGSVVVHGHTLDALAVIVVPVRVTDSVEGVVLAGWVHDQFPDPLSTDRLARRLGVPYPDLWHVVRQQSPVGRDKMVVYGELLHSLVEAVARERTETLRERAHAEQLRALNTSARHMAAADDEPAIFDAVVAAAHRLVPADTVRVVLDDGVRAPAGSLHVPVRLPDGATLATIEVEGLQAPVTTLVQGHLDALAAQAAIALLKVRRFDVATSRQEALARNNKAKDEFLSVLSHELRTPLTPILGWAAMLRRGLLQGDTRAMASAVDAIERNARQQLQLVDEMLDLSRLLNNKVQLEPEPVRPLDVLASAVAAAQGGLAGRRLHIDMDVGHALPSVLADPRRLQQVLGNLIANAIKFTPDDGRVTVGARATADGVEFSVRDTGIGLGPDELSVIFDRFHQADSSSTREHGGLGIGLSVVKGLVELHGGRAWASSPGPGRGATFVVRFPAVHGQSARETSGRPAAGVSAAGADAAETGGTAADVASAVPRQDAARDSPPAHQAEAPRRPGGGLRLLIVDDCDDSLDMLRFMLEAEGYEVTTASSVAVALERAQAQPPHAIVSDIGMPLHDGYELVRRVREMPAFAQTPVVALTGYASHVERETAVEAGFTAHIAKPVDPDALIALLRTLVGAASKPGAAG